MGNTIVLLCLLIIGYLSGRYFEKKHFKSIEEREKKYSHIPVITGEWKSQLKDGEEGFFVGEGLVVASDYFKTFSAMLISIFGGRLKSYESLFDRGRREAILRLLESAESQGAYKIVNLRIETSNINAANKNQGMPCVELFAYATALRKING